MTLNAWRYDSLYLLTDHCPVCNHCHTVAAVSAEISGFSMKCGAFALDLCLKAGRVPKRILAELQARGQVAAAKETQFVAWEGTANARGKKTAKRKRKRPQQAATPAREFRGSEGGRSE